MIQLGNYTISFEANIFVILLGILVLAAFSYFIYKFTIPQISTPKKIFLITIRTLALALILLLIFEPLFIVSDSYTEQPKNFVMVDNSRSIVLQDSISRTNTVHKTIDEIKNIDEGNFDFFTFGSNLKQLNPDSAANIKFNSHRTNFENIFSLAANEKENLASITIISDGVINDGYNPIYEAERYGIPVFTIGVGDTTIKKDIFIKNVFHNRFIYQDTPTQIAVDVGNNNYTDRLVSVRLLENNRVISSKNVELSETGINRIVFDYEAESPGEKRMSFTVDQLEDEENTRNNIKPFYINVLKSKLSIVLIAGSPSSDLSIIKTSLEANEQFDVTSIVQVNSQNILNYEDNRSKLDSAEVLFLIDFPLQNSSQELVGKVTELISQKYVPFFFLLGSNNNLSSLNQLSGFLPFTISQVQNDYFSAQPIISNNANSIITGEISAWNNLPPVYYNASEFKAKPGTSVLLSAKIRNIETQMPLVISSSIGNSRNISVLATEIWRWKLQGNNKELFDNFIHNSVKWLNADKTKSNFTVETDRKFYSAEEEIVFTAQLYNESLEPKNNAEVKVDLYEQSSGDNASRQIILESIGNGLYTGTVTVNKPGEYIYTAAAVENNIEIENARGNFSVGELNLEALNTRLDDEYLKLLSRVTEGKFYYANNTENLKNILQQINQAKTTIKTETTEYKLWSLETILILIVILFASEWFIRKKEGML